MAECWRRFLRHGHCVHITRGVLLLAQVFEGGVLKTVMNNYGKKMFWQF